MLRLSRFVPKRRFLRVLSFLAAFAFTTMVLFFFAIRLASLRGYQKGKQFLAVLQTSQTIELEQFRGAETLKTVRFEGHARSNVLDALPPEYFLPLTLKLCFKPHHKIIGLSPGQFTNTFLICFECDQGKFENDSSIFDLPSIWKTNLRQLFLNSQIPLTVPDK